MGKGNDILYSVVKDDKDKLNEFSVFDRIINLKFTTTNHYETEDERGEVALKADEFIIRSDYEITYPGNIGSLMNGDFSHYHKYIVKRCDIKPSIKVQYNQVTNGTAIAIDLFISNFFLMTKDGRNLMNFNSKTYDLAKIEIQMGYIGQFNKALGLDTKEVSNLTVKDLFNFEAGSDSGIQSITIDNVEYVKTDRIVPEYTLHIHGYVGSTIEVAKKEVRDTKYSELLKSAFTLNSNSNKTEYEQLFYKYITRRFLNKHTFDSKLGVPVKENGFYSEADADKYGLHVFCSKGVKELKPIAEKKDNNGEVLETGTSTVLDLGGRNNTALSAMQRLFEFTNRSLCYVRLNDGNFLAFLSSEIEDGNIKELFSELKEYLNSNATGNYFNNILPAVYNISLDALAVITCPFFSWVNPFQELKFASRYVSSSLIAFYAGFTPDVMSFFATNVQVTFATVEDINEMQITAVPQYNTLGA